MEMTLIHPLPTQTSPRPVMPNGPLFRYIRVLQQVTGIYRWTGKRACRENPGRGLEDPPKTDGSEKRFLPGIRSR